MPADPLIDRRSGKKRRVTKKMKIALRALMRGEARTATAAAEKAGLSADYLYRALALPHVRAYAIEQIQTLKASGALLAMPRLAELLRSDSDHVSLDATKLMLGLNGHRPESDPNVAISLNTSPGYVIILKSARDNSPDEPLIINHSPEIRDADQETD